MSYSIFVTGTSKATALAALAEKFDAEVVAYQPEHKADRAVLLDAAYGALAILHDDKTNRPINIKANGSLSWIFGGLTDAPKLIEGVTLMINIAHDQREGEL